MRLKTQSPLGRASERTKRARANTTARTIHMRGGLLGYELSARGGDLVCCVVRLFKWPLPGVLRSSAQLTRKPHKTHLVSDDLPELGADLVAALAGLDVHDFAHGLKESARATATGERQIQRRYERAAGKVARGRRAAGV